MSDVCVSVVPRFFDFVNSSGESMRVDVRVEGDVLLFRASHVAECLGYANPSKLVELLGDEPIPQRDTLRSDGKPLKVPFLTEKQLYKGILKSRADNAEHFQDWVAGEVLPSIRKTGSFSMKPAEDIFDDLPSEVKALVQVTRMMQAQQKQLTAVSAKVDAQAEALSKKADASEECLSAIQIDTLEQLWHNECYLHFKDRKEGGRAVGNIKSQLKKRFLSRPGTCTYKDIAQKYFDLCLAFSKELIVEKLANARGGWV